MQNIISGMGDGMRVTFMGWKHGLICPLQCASFSVFYMGVSDSSVFSRVVSTFFETGERVQRNLSHLETNCIPDSF